MIDVLAITSLEVLFSSLVSLVINVVYATFTTILAIGVLWVLDHFVFKNIDFPRVLETLTDSIDFTISFEGSKSKQRISPRSQNSKKKYSQIIKRSFHF